MHNFDAETLSIGAPKKTRGALIIENRKLYDDLLACLKAPQFEQATEFFRIATNVSYSELVRTNKRLPNYYKEAPQLIHEYGTSLYIWNTHTQTTSI